MIKKYLLFTYKSFKQISYLAKESKIVLYLVLVLMGGVQSVYSQATFTTTATAAELKNAIESEGVIITNPVITIGSLTQRGVFSNGKLGAGLEIDKGIALTTSSIVNAFSTNNELANSNSFLFNYVDMDLRQLNTSRTDDVVIFEFDFVEKPNYKGVLLEYQFASEEYPDYVGSTFNDLFGFFVSDPSGLDPNIPDGDLNNNGVYDIGEEPALNLAVVPGSTNYVSINNINVGSPGASSSNPPLGDFTKGSFYINNGHANDDGSSITPIPANANTGPKPLLIEFNGATKKLPTNMNLIEGVTYHMKIVIADLGDGSYDSGVFISGITSLPELVSKNDSGTVTENIGGVAVQNVLTNDMRAGNVNPLVSEVELAQIITSNSGVSLDVNTGAVNVTAGTPVGVYQLEYSICDPSPNNCSNSFVYITVLSDNDKDGIADIDDVDDDNDGILDTVECPGVGVTFNDSFETPNIQALGVNTLSGRPDADLDGEVDAYLSQNSIEGWAVTDANSFDIIFDVFNASNGNQSIDLYGTPNATGIQKTYSGFTEGVPVSFSIDYSSVENLFEAQVSVDYGSGPVLLTTLKPGNIASVGSPGVSGARATSIVWNNFSTNLLPTASGTIKIIIQSTSLGIGQSGILIDNVALAQSPCKDTDGDGILNSLDTDSDNDGCPDTLEAAGNIGLSNLTALSGGSVGGNSQNLGVNSDTNGSPIVSGQGALGYTQNLTIAVTDVNDKSACSVDLSITKKVDKPVLKVGQIAVFTLVLKNDGPQSATGIKVKDLLPAGLVYNAEASTIPLNTTYTSGTGIWDLGAITLIKNQTIELKIAATLNTVGAIITNKTEIFLSNKTDIDSTPNNNK